METTQAFVGEGSILEAIILGIIQGFTEFLPISSSAHLIFFSWLMDGRAIPISLNIAMHMGTTAAVLIFFWKDWFEILKNAVLKRDLRFLTQLFVGSIPAGLVGALFKDQIELIFHHPLSTVAPLAIVGFILWFTDVRCPESRTVKELSYFSVFFIGVAQAFALIPGVSRSGSTIMASRWFGLSRTEATRFSFLLGTPAMVGAALLSKDELMSSIDQPVFYWGVVFSCVVGCVAIKFMLQYVKRYGFLSFAIYRLILAGIILAVLNR